jgi:putative transcriptional regulator
MKCKLRVIFAERGIKQRWFARKIGINEGTLSLIMSGKSTPTLPVAMRIAKELDMRIEEIWQDQSN